MSELQYSVNQGKDAAGLPGTYKLGGWFATADFNDQHFGTTGTGRVVSLGSDPSATPLKHSGDGGIYAVADQMIWRGKQQSLSLFLRGGYAPRDRNLVSYYVDGGAALKGPFNGRPDDVLSFAVAYAKISPDAAAADRDAGLSCGTTKQSSSSIIRHRSPLGGPFSRTSSTSSIPTAVRIQTIRHSASGTLS